MTEATADGAPQTIRHQHDGQTWEIPLDLLATQRELFLAHQASSAAASADDDALQAARARTSKATMEIYRHPWWAKHQAAGRRYQADCALKDLAKAEPAP
jgi:hypothetical protein